MNIKNIKIIVTTSTHNILLQKNKSEIQGNKFTQQYFFKKLHITIFISLKFLMNNFSFKQELRERGKRCIERIRCWQNHVVFFAANWNSSPQISTTLFSFIEVHPLIWVRYDRFIISCFLILAIKRTLRFYQLSQTYGIKESYC
jgi:hypothetical protein